VIGTTGNDLADHAPHSLSFAIYSSACILRSAKSMPHPVFTLHPQLAADTVTVGELGLSYLAAIDHGDYPWLVLVPRITGAVEIADLGDDAARLMAEIVAVSRALKHVTRCDKINVGAIGNVVAQLHVHIVGRRRGDPLWPKPVWGTPVRKGDAGALIAFRHAIAAELGLAQPA
jgi:diadenosine tetraphosphate (Ap4A) HIT family hydrolase